MKPMVRSQPDAQLDLRGTPCPLNFVRAKLHLQKMQPGSCLELWLDPGEPVAQVPDGLIAAGYEIESLSEGDSYVTLRVRSPLSHP